MLVRQTEDLGRQVQYILRQKERLEHPELRDIEDTEMIDGEGGGSGQSDNIEEVITNNLVLFKSLPDLQLQNQKLLKIVRELGAKMESEEREWQESVKNEWEVERRELNEAMQEAARAIAVIEETVTREKVAKEGAIRERDALRGMLDRLKKEGGAAGVGADLNGIGHIGQAKANATGSGDEPEGLKNQLAEVQREYEAYRTEMDVDGGRIREELVKVQRENGQLSGALAKANAKIEYMTGSFISYFTIPLYQTTALY